ncbi:hypothetical protein DEU56DRAFT_832698 [Suillus clintonianus]|uniref:uncharacterized protein n=1 Tax=Suillus clintonianus TaxID=1904413 RepID=UPI001B881418|nr:uncharacterized protein DEU56DRAFT_832698 [Suillus clintonianus]KAG2122228.1 hypothetical protein DEU56DRAFT_832698 [Suillus clintonianus]
MALQPSLRSTIIAGAYDAPHTLDIFLDYVCPFSAKLSFAIDSVLKPLVDAGGLYHGKVKVIMRLQVQPWHATSTYTHEAGLSVVRAAPEKFWAFSLALFKQQADFFDGPASTMTPLQIREKLASIAAQFLTEEQVTMFKDLLKLKPTPNGGIGVTDDLKYTIKFARQNGVHVSPTALWDGLIANQISSSWGEKEWSEFLAKNVAV